MAEGALDIFFVLEKNIFSPSFLRKFFFWIGGGVVHERHPQSEEGGQCGHGGRSVTDVRTF